MTHSSANRGRKRDRIARPAVALSAAVLGPGHRSFRLDMQHSHSDVCGNVPKGRQQKTVAERCLVALQRGRLDKYGEDNMRGLCSVLTLFLSLGLTTATSPTSAQDEIPPVRGGVIVTSTDVEPASIDPGFGNAPGTDMRTYRLVYENLFIQAENGQFVPQLATEWETSDDGLTMTFKLRDGVKFHDGTLFNAEAAAFNLNRMVDPAKPTRNGEFLSDMARAEAIDEYTLKLTMKQPSALVMSSLANESGMIASPTALQKWGSEYGRNPVGTGPFKFDSWVSGDHLKFVKNDDYWGTDENGEKLPYLDGAEVRIIVDATLKVIAAEAGTVDIVDTIQPRDYGRIESNPDLSLVAGPETLFNLLSFNLTAPPFKDNLKLRQAVTTAIDRESMLKVIYPGTGIVMQGRYPPYAQEYAKNLKDYQYDPEKAAQLYRESGYSGPPLTMTMIQRDPDTTIAQIIQAQLAQAGIPIQLELLERLSWTDKVYGHRYEMALHRWGSPAANNDLANLYGRTGGANHTGITALYDLVDEARRTLDDAKRNAMYGELQQYLVDNAVQMTLVGQQEHFVVNKRIHGLTRELNGAFGVTAAWREAD
ncbi:ABC transporter substrate-binding protein [Marinivivus vitaminiproducens]|uniref:ABC transporter substrate-binding protein n=1 Tax=Marinivivus vitaminiproducens TaxID=3035935 RepID=UPI0027A834A8|nr:ABC transporter substrate-binding protein [Geminicoccaceae bacterium SCSIO 64248]